MDRRLGEDADRLLVDAVLPDGRTDLAEFGVVQPDRSDQVGARIGSDEQVDGDAEGEREALVDAAADDEPAVALLELVAMDRIVEEIGEVRDRA